MSAEVDSQINQLRVHVDDPTKPWYVGGGLTYSKAMLQPLGEALVMYCGASDVRFVTFQEGMEDPSLVRRAAEGTNCLIHSAGGVPFAQARPGGMLSVTSADGVERRNPLQLVADYVKLDAHQLATSRNPHIPEAVRDANRAAVVDKTEQLLHPYLFPSGFLFRVIGPISRTSTVEALSAIQRDTAVPVAAVFMEEGEFRFMEEGLPLAQQLGVFCMKLAGKRHEFPTTEPVAAVPMIFDVPELTANRG